eukprot:3592322-Pleurochrysis_carterae.AAC.3
MRGDNVGCAQTEASSIFHDQNLLSASRCMRVVRRIKIPRSPPPQYPECPCLHGANEAVNWNIVNPCTATAVVDYLVAQSSQPSTGD